MENLPPSWQLASKSEGRTLDRHFSRDLGFGEHRDFAGSRTIIEPEVSKTYALQLRGEPESATYEALSVRLCNDYIRLFRAVVPRDDFVYAYDPYHAAYKFWPHQEFEFGREGDWPIPPYPDGDYCAFFTSNLKSCLFGFPWRKPTVCVIGARFLDAMKPFRPTAFEQVVRVGGKPLHR